MKDNTTAASACDVVVIGGSLSGAAAALLLKRRAPQLRVVVLERTEQHKRRVGEATIELSTFFLARVLGLTRFLNETQLNKQGLRYWFSNEQTTNLGDCSEVGGKYHSRVPAYLVDRAVLDAEVLRQAGEAGVEVVRRATVSKVDLQSGGTQKIYGSVEGKAMTWEARWVIDASGVAALLARQQGWWKANEDHPTAVAWSRWRGVKDWDDRELMEKYPKWAAACFGQRGTATNHYLGNGWWAWSIALKGGDVSVGFVFDQRIFDWEAMAKGGKVAEKLRAVLMQHPAAREMMSEATCNEGDIHWRRNLAYSCSTLAGDGFTLVGDAAGFLDPLYSPGLDWVSFTVMRSVDLILRERRGEAVAALVTRHNRDFQLSYARWFDAIYRNKYAYLNEYDLMKLALLLDVGLYYLGVASQPFRRGESALLEPYFSTTPSIPFYHVMRTYNRRFAAIATKRKADGRAGRFNTGHRFLFGGFSFASGTAWTVAKAFAGWAKVELTEGWRSWFRPKTRGMAVEPATSVPQPAVQRS